MKLGKGIALISFKKRDESTSLRRSLHQEQRERFAPSLFTNRATRAIRTLKRANRTFDLKKRVIRTKNQRANP